MEQMWTAVLCLIDIIKDNETLMDSHNRRQTPTDMNAFAGHLVSSCKMLYHISRDEKFVSGSLFTYKNVYVLSSTSQEYRTVKVVFSTEYLFQFHYH